MKVNGKVWNIPTIKKRLVTYDIMDEDDILHIISTGNQAKKDIVFIKKGQSVEIDGEIFGNTIWAKNEHIDIKAEVKRNKNR